tara:strand:+ start:706 stop:1089 length:384 start_codon:yes stop_codon:yes gene_type:complete
VVCGSWAGQSDPTEMTDSRVDPSHRGLKTLVIGMGVLILVGVVVLGVAIYQRSQVNRGDDAPRLTDELPVSFGTHRLELGSNDEVLDAFVTGQRLVLLVGSNGSIEQVIVLDLTSGEIVGNILTATE